MKLSETYLHNLLISSTASMLLSINNIQMIHLFHRKQKILRTRLCWYCSTRTLLDTKMIYLTDNVKFNDNLLLNEDDKSKLLNILIKQWNCFDYYDNRLRKCSISHAQQHINTGDSAPIKSKVRPLSPLVADKVKEKLDDLEKRGIIRKSLSPWASPSILQCQPIAF